MENAYTLQKLKTMIGAKESTKLMEHMHVRQITKHIIFWINQLQHVQGKDETTTVTDTRRS